MNIYLYWGYPGINNTNCYTNILQDIVESIYFLLLILVFILSFDNIIMTFRGTHRYLCIHHSTVVIPGKDDLLIN